MKMRATISLLALAMVGTLSATAAGCGPAPSFALPTFSEPVLVDPVKAGGEPSIQPLADGSLLYASHAGTTHLYKGNDPTDFVTPYTGTIYTWRSTDMGETWTPVKLLEQTTGVELPEGFSDPSTAVDRAGNVYISAIDTATVYVGRSADGTGFVGNKLAAFNMDREWLAADLDGVLYMTASPFGSWPTPDGPSSQVLWRSSDGGATWDTPLGRNGAGDTLSPILVNPVDGALVWPRARQQDRLGFRRPVRVYPNARSGDLDTYFDAPVDGYLPTGDDFFVSSAADDAGNLYIASIFSRQVQITSSTDGGHTWHTQTVAHSTGEARWPWVAAGADGRVAVAWLQQDYSDDHAWHVQAATSISAHGWTDACSAERPGAWYIDQVTSEPIHHGEICSRGLSCNTSTDERDDRRLGDYFTIAITPSGSLVMAFGDTAHDPDAAISHPAFVAQTGGVDFRP